MLFTRQIVTNSRVAQDHLRQRDYMRNAANAQELSHTAGLREFNLTVNSARIPEEVYREFDNVTIERMRSDDGDTFLNDLMPLAKSVNIGKMIYENRKASDSGIVKASMSGQTGIKFDQVEYNYDGTLIPIYDAGFFRNFRELEAGRSEGFDALIDDQRETIETVRVALADSFMDGHKDEDGNFLKVKTYDWQGMRNDSRVAQVDLGIGGVNFDFTDSTKTGDENKNALITVLNTLYITNNCAKDVTVYVSREIARNWERSFSSNYAGKDIIDQLSKLQGVAAIKVSNKLTGNQLMAFPLDGSVKPISGMGMSTFALPRPMYNSNHEFVTAVANGWFVNNDYFSKTCALYATE